MSLEQINFCVAVCRDKLKVCRDKLKDAKIKEYEKHSTKYEQKIESLEYRIRELENTIKTWNDHANIGVSPNSTVHVPSQQNTSPPPNTMKQPTRLDPGPYYQLIKGIHDRVSAYVLLKAEKQIENLIDIDKDLNTTDPNNKDQTGSYRYMPNESSVRTACSVPSEIINVQTNQPDDTPLICGSGNTKNHSYEPNATNHSNVSCQDNSQRPDLGIETHQCYTLHALPEILQNDIINPVVIQNYDEYCTENYSTYGGGVNQNIVYQGWRYLLRHHFLCTQKFWHRIWMILELGLLWLAYY